MHIPVWYVPSFYGDIRIDADGPQGCIVVADKITPLEAKALEKLVKHGHKKGWIGDVITEMGEGRHRVAAPVADVAKFIAKQVKATRTVVHAVRFSNGKMQEILDEVPGVAAPVAAVAAAPAVATSVAAPTRGCPAPAFDKAELKARQVLLSFLTPEQAADFRAKNRFITEGASGRRYMVTSRYAKDELAMYTRSLYGIDEERVFCVHDWAVPASEEMLGLHVLLQLPNWEDYLRNRDNVHDTDERQVLDTLDDPSLS
jgi:hypothetical protein